VDEARSLSFDEKLSEFQNAANFPANYVAIEDIQLLGFVGGCLSTNQLQTFTQKFKITIGQSEYFPTTTINIKRGNENGTLLVDRTITTP
jgi:hypothetical protein